MSKVVSRKPGAVHFVEKGMRPPTFELAYGLSKVLVIDMTDTLEAAYMARAKYNLEKEKEALARLVQQRKLHLNISDIVPDKF